MVLFIDSFLFNGEEIVKLRLEYLYNYVDYFYIVESIYTFSANKKPYFYIDTCAEWFAPYISKIKFVKIHDKLNILPDNRFPTSNLKSFYEEKLQRNYIRSILFKDFTNKDFLLALCDVDEFYNITKLPSKEMMFELTQTKELLLRMKMYYYNFNYYLNDNWEMAFIISSTFLKTVEDLDHVRVNKLGDSTIRHESGWHFTYFMKPEEIQRKLMSFSHVDINIFPFNNKDYLDFVVSNGVDYQQRDEFKLQNIPFDSEHHQYPELFRKYYQ
jgi:beta-1,4-mannosyl-glycoprotein beta-1,4-N-acetylglucosaminyltransferase